MAPPTELVYCSVATRAKSAAKLFTIRSICILLIRGMLSLSSFTPGLELGDGMIEVRGSVACSSCSISRTKVACSWSSWRSSALTLAPDRLEVVLEVVEDALQALLVLHTAVELGEHLVGIVDRRDWLVRARRRPSGSRCRRGRGP